MYALFKLNKFYDPVINLVPFYIAVFSGMLCFVLMGFIFKNQCKVKEHIQDINSEEE